MEDRTYIREYRDEEDHPVYQNHKAWRLWRYYCRKARRTPKEIEWNKVKIVIEVCEVVTGRRQAARDTYLTEQNIRTCNKILENFKMIEKSTSKSTSKFTVYKLTAPDIYDIINTDANQDPNQQVTSRQPASNQQVTTNNNDNNKKNEKKLNNKDLKKGKLKHQFSTSKTFSVFLQFYFKKVKPVKIADAMVLWETIVTKDAFAKLLIERVANQAKFNHIEKTPNPDLWLSKEYWTMPIDAGIDDQLRVEYYCWNSCDKETFNCKVCGKLWVKPKKDGTLE